MIREGDSGDRFYVIESGTVEVTKEGRHVATLGPGDFVGEIALLRDVPRVATVTATSDTVLQALDRTLRQIDAALARLHAGRYGLCAACSESIPVPRLRALPFATLCVTCQEQREGAPR